MYKNKPVYLYISVSSINVFSHDITFYTLKVNYVLSIKSNKKYYLHYKNNYLVPVASNHLNLYINRVINKSRKTLQPATLDKTDSLIVSMPKIKEKVRALHQALNSHRQRR